MRHPVVGAYQAMSRTLVPFFIRSFIMMSMHFYVTTMERNEIFPQKVG